MSKSLKVEELTPLSVEQKSCAHCDLPVPQARLTKKGSSTLFCCSGCEYVYSIINDLGLDDFYQIKSEYLAGAAPANPKKAEFKQFDDDEFLTLFTVGRESQTREITFSLDGMYCAACVWLVEKLPEIHEGILVSRVDFGRARVRVKIDTEHTSISEVARLLDSLGYTPHPIQLSDLGKSQNRSDKGFLLRLAIAGVAAGNSMMLAVSMYEGDYSGIEEKYSTFFRWVSFLIATPAIVYSATPFYKAAWNGLKSKVLHIDLPISLGILLGFSASAVNTLYGSGHVYFDSICTLIFLLLLGRWLQRKSLAHSLESKGFLGNLVPTKANLITAGGIEEVFSGSLRKDNLLTVYPNELFAADGVVENGNSKVDMSILTGESTPSSISPSDPVFAGTRNLSEEITIRVQAPYEQTRIAGVLRLAENAESLKADIVKSTDLVSRYFVFIVLGLATTTGIYFYLTIGFFEALDRTLALLVVTCPCALGLAAPLAMTVALRSAASSGIFIRGEDVIERMTRIKEIYFDKTGTLTTGALTVEKVIPLRDYNEQEKSNLIEAGFALEQHSSHPIGKCLGKHFSSFRLDEPDYANRFEEIQYLSGKGAIGTDSDGNHWRIGSWRWLEEETVALSNYAEQYFTLVNLGLSPVVLEKNGEPLVIFGVGDSVKPGASKLVEELLRKDFGVSIISGDVPEVVESVATELSIDKARAISSQSPEDKVAIVQKSQELQETAMVGDGVNDAASLKAAGVGFAVSGGADVCVRYADVYFSDSEPTLMLQALRGASRTLSVIHRNLAFSLIYNCLGAIAAIGGYISPLAAAVLMPISSLTVVLSSVTASTFERTKWR